MTDASDEADGRHARRERNREAVVEAILALYREGVLWPSSEQIASRAGVSARSIFRYFADVDDLAREAVARQQEYLAPLWAIELEPDDPVGDRITSFVAHRARLFEAMGEVGRVARIRSTQQPRIATELGRVRKALRDQAAAAFGPELAALSKADRGALLATIDTLTSWEAHDLMRNDQGLSAAGTRAAMALGLRRLLAPVSVSR